MDGASSCVVRDKMALAEFMGRILMKFERDERYDVMMLLDHGVSHLLATSVHTSDNREEQSKQYRNPPKYIHTIHTCVCA